MFLVEWLSALIKISFQIVFAIVFAIVCAIPFKIAWNCVAPKYLYFIPEVFQSIPYWHFVAILLVFTFIGEQIGKITPTLVSINNNK